MESQQAKISNAMKTSKAGPRVRISSLPSIPFCPGHFEAALGAQPRDVFRLVVGNGMGLVLAGLLIGAAGAAAATSVLKGMLFHVRRADPIALGAVAILLMFAAWLACYRRGRLRGLIPYWH